MKKLLLLIVFLFVFLVGANRVSAQYPYPSPIYTNINIDKAVAWPNEVISNGRTYDSLRYTDNIAITDLPRFRPGQYVYFRISVRNTSNINLYNVVVRDYVPLYLEPISGPGSYDQNTRIITLNAGDFTPNQEKIYYFVMQIATQDRWPTDVSILRFENKAQASTTNAFSEDRAILYAEKVVTSVSTPPTQPATTTYYIYPTITGIPGTTSSTVTYEKVIGKGGEVTYVPSAGPEYGLLIAGLEMLTLSAGVFLTKKRLGKK